MPHIACTPISLTTIAVISRLTKAMLSITFQPRAMIWS